MKDWKRNNPSIYRDKYDMPLWIGQRVIFTESLRNGNIEEWIGTIVNFEGNQCIINVEFDKCNYTCYCHKNNKFEKIRYFDEELDKEFLIISTKKIGEDKYVKKWFENFKKSKIKPSPFVYLLD